MDTNPRTARVPAARGSARRWVREFVAASLTGLAVAAAAVAQPPRAATLLPPQPLEAGDARPVARGAAPDTLYPATTPVTRGPAFGTTGVQPGPAWLSGIDPNVLPAAGQAGAPSRVQPASNTTTSKPTPPAESSPSAFTRGVDKMKGFITGDKPAFEAIAPAQQTNPQPGQLPSPFRGTTPNGAPIYAGPPAYGWYGYGTVTPGANPLAPTGQYPRASASWYSVTGATPGAFPVPVMNPLRSPPGNDPPAYQPTAVARAPMPTYTPQTYTPQSFVPPPQPRPLVQPPLPSAPAPTPTGSKFGPAAAFPPVPARLSPNVGASATRNTMPPADAFPTETRPVKAAPPVIPPVPVGVPTLAPLPTTIRPVVSSALPASSPLPVKPVLVPPPVVPAPPKAADPVSAAPTRPATPATLPVSLRTDDVRWQPQAEPEAAPTGTWAPAPGTQRRPTPPPESEPVWEPGATDTTRPPVARGQVADAAPQADPLLGLVQAVCRGKANGIEVRRTGGNKLMVCFEVRTEAEAAQLVKELSARPELGPYHVDFAVLVK